MIRSRICLLVLLLVPFAVYWQTIFSEYGLRDDYSNIREAREEPGRLVNFTASHGRPLYGALQETSMTKIDEVKYLCLLRFAAVTLIAILGVALWRQLYHSGWTEIEAAVIGLGVALLPGAQVIAGWASLWPHAMALLLALAGFCAIEAELERGGLKRAIALLGGSLIYGVAAVLYQSNALFAVVPLAAVLLVRISRGASSDLRWIVTHLSALLTGLLGAYLLIRGLFSNGIFQASARMDLETHPLTKLAWFFSNPIPNALGLYTLRDDFNTGAYLFWTAVAIVVGFIFWGCRTQIRRVGAEARRRVLVCVLGLPFLAHAVSLAAAERATGYRTLLALSGLALVLVVFAFRSLRLAQRIPLVAYQAGLIGLAAWAAFSAHFNTRELIALPQSYEWETMRGAVMRSEFPRTSRVFIVTPAREDRATTRIFSDEFGSISSDSDWVPQEMFKAALHERYPAKLPKGTRLEFTLGRTEPDAKDYDLVIDMRKFKERAEQP